jgi:transketolase
MASASQSESVLDRFAAYGFEVERIEDGHDLQAISDALARARANNGKPTFIEVKTVIGKGIPEVAGTAAGHGESGAKFAETARQGLGLPEETFYVSDEVRAYFADHKSALKAKRQEWDAVFSAWQAANPEKAALLQSGLARELPSDLMDKVQVFAEDAKIATRAAGSQIINDLAKACPLLVSGSADLHGSTKNYLKEMGDFSREDRAGRNLLVGIREHAMGAIVNGIGYYGIFRPSGATFAVFADYMRGSVRISALAGLPIFHIWTHDSVGVGEDGPTHQPVEQTATLRLIPNMDVWRPCDTAESAVSWIAAMTSGEVAPPPVAAAAAAGGADAGLAAAAAGWRAGAGTGAVAGAAAAARRRRRRPGRPAVRARACRRPRAVARRVPGEPRARTRAPCRDREGDRRG